MPTSSSWLLLFLPAAAAMGGGGAVDTKRDTPISRLAAMGRAGEAGATAICGAAAGVVAYATVTPLETVKTIVQAEGGKNRAALRSVISKRGKRGLFKGLSSMWTAGVPYSIVMYSVYQPFKLTCRELLTRGDDNPNPGKLILADGFAAAFSEFAGIFVFTPGDLIAKRIMRDPEKYAGVRDAFRTITASQGKRGLFTGIGPCLLRDLPYTAVQFGLFEYLAAQLTARLDLEKPTFAQSLVIGAVAALAASTLTLPIDVIKSQVQLASPAAVAAAGGSVGFAAQLLRKEGQGILLRGYPAYTSINIAKWSASQAVFFSLR